MKLPHALLGTAVALLGCTALQPANASVSTAAWVMATSVCNSLGAGLSIRESARVGLGDTQGLFRAEIHDPAFQQLMVREATRMCPGLLIRAVNRGQQL
jgi:hypothetical protein